jgi:hypothetical protein
MITSLVMTVTSHLDMSHLLPQAHASGTLEHFPLTPSCFCLASELCLVNSKSLWSSGTPHSPCPSTCRSSRP